MATAEEKKTSERKDERFIIIFRIVNIALGLSCNAYCYHHHCYSQPAFQNEMKCGWRCCWRWGRSLNWVGGCVSEVGKFSILGCRYLNVIYNDFSLCSMLLTLRGLLNVLFRILNVLQTLYSEGNIENLNNLSLQLNWLLIFVPSSIELLGFSPFSILPSYHATLATYTLRDLCRNCKKMLSIAQVAKFNIIIGFFLT